MIGGASIEDFCFLPIQVRLAILSDGGGLVLGRNSLLWAMIYIFTSEQHFGSFERRIFGNIIPIWTFGNFQGFDGGNFMEVSFPVGNRLVSNFSDFEFFWQQFGRMHRN